MTAPSVQGVTTLTLHHAEGERLDIKLTGQPDALWPRLRELMTALEPLGFQPEYYPVGGGPARRFSPSDPSADPEAPRL